MYKYAIRDFEFIFLLSYTANVILLTYLLIFTYTIEMMDICE